MKKVFYLLFFVFLVLLIFNCSKSTKTYDGKIKIYLTDAQAPYDSVIIMVSRISVHKGSSLEDTLSDDTLSNWIVLSDSIRTYDLLQLRNGMMAVLDSGGLAPGHYTQIRLKVTDSCYVVEDGQRHYLRIPSGQQTGIKLVHQFTIEQNKLYELVLDFDADRSIHQTGNGVYQLKPTIRVVALVTSGEIKGKTNPKETEIFGIADDDTLAHTFSDTSGYFELVALPPATYSVSIIPLDPLYADTTITGVVVTAGSSIDLGTINLRLK